MIGSLSLDQLTVLVTIEATGSFSAAGRELRRVQSAISSVVQTLETNLGVQLFDRSGHKPRLTAAGRLLVGQARRVLGEAAQFERTAATISAGLETELTLTVDSIAPAEPVIASLARLQATFPDLSVTLYTESISASVRRVRDGTATLGLCALFPTAEQDFRVKRYASIKLVPVVASNHLLTQETRPLTREILAEHVQLILTDPQKATGPNYSVVSNRVWRFVDIGRRLDFLLAGFGWCMMPQHLVADHIASGRLTRLGIDEPSLLPDFIPLYAIHQRSRPLGIAASWLLQDFIETGPAATG